MPSEAAEITKMLDGVRRGEAAAANQLMEAVYADLKGIARHLFANERRDHTLQPTALVHEAWMRIFSGVDVPWNDRVHFYAVAARQMRHLLADHGRAVGAKKRGDGLKVAFEDNLHGASFDSCEFDEVNDLLDRLQRTDPDAARVVEMKFFSGMSDEEVAAEMKCSHSSVRRHWSFAKAWLRLQMAGQDANAKN